MQNLLIQYRGKIDVIYIDPPYGKDSMGEFAQTNYENAITRDNLLSMLHPRLTLARQLLTDSGVIFCSIDDRNQAYVKGLFDEVFGESDFVCNFVWKSKLGKVGTTESVSSTHEYILCSAKNIEYAVFKSIEKENNGRKENLRQWGQADRREDRPSMFYPIEIDGVKVFPIKENGVEGRWRVSKTRAEELLKLGQLELVEKESKHEIYRIFSSGVSSTPEQTLLLDDTGTTARGTLTLKSLGLENTFGYPKPVELMKHFVRICSNKNSIIIDFFAGSGTTGQAVLELNKQDGGNRKFILVTNNEKTNTTPNGIAHDVTTKRLKRVMTGKCYDGTDDFKWLDKNEPLGDSLDVYDIATISPYDNKPFKVIDETLYGQQKLDVNEKVKWVCENFEAVQRTVEGDKDYTRRIGGGE